MSAYGNRFWIEMDPDIFRQILQVERAVTGRSAEFMISRAATEAAKQARESLGERVRQRYNGPFPGGTEGRSEIKKGTIGKPGAELVFKSALPAIADFKAAPKAAPTKFLKTGKKRIVPLHIGKDDDDVVYRWLGPQKKYHIKVSQLTSTGMQETKDAFIKNNGVFIRTGSSRWAFKKVWGSSDRAMVRQDEVYGAEEPRISQIFVEQCEKQIEAALAKG